MFQKSKKHMNELKRDFQFQARRLCGNLLCIGVILVVSLSALPDAWALQATPTTLSFQAVQGGISPSSQMLMVLKNNNHTVSWSSSENATWLSVSPTTGSITSSAQISVSVIPAGLAAGTYTATVVITATKGGSVSVPVALTVTAAPVPPAIGASPSSLSFAATQGGANPSAQTVSIINTGGGTLSWSASANTTWLAVSPASASGNGVVTVSVTTGILTAGSYTGNITLSAPGASNMAVPVTFTITAAPTISLSPSSLSYAATQGAANPANQNISLTNSGGTLSWMAGDNASWMGVSPASGISSSTLTGAVNTSGLAAGIYNGTITVSAAGASSKTVDVTLTVSAPLTSSATVTWTANTDSDLAGYKIYCATTSGGYGAPIATLPGNVTTYIASGLQLGTTYFFVITAYDSTGNESLRSNEVSKSVY